MKKLFKVRWSNPHDLYETIVVARTAKQAREIVQSGNYIEVTIVHKFEEYITVEEIK